jgi:hypothetical protein
LEFKSANHDDVTVLKKKAYRNYLYQLDGTTEKTGNKGNFNFDSD